MNGGKLDSRILLSIGNMERVRMKLPYKFELEAKELEVLCVHVAT